MKKVRKPLLTENEENIQAGPPSENEEDIDNIRNIQKEFLDKMKTDKVNNAIDMKIADMTMNELKEVIKEAVMEEVQVDMSEKLVTPPKASTVAPVIENAIKKMTMGELKEFIMENIVENKDEDIVVPIIEENDITFMDRNEMKDVIKETVMMNGGDSDVVAPIIEETIDRLTSKELKDVIMEVVENDKPEEIVAPLVQDAINHMTMPELKEFIAETVMKESDETEEIIAPLVEDALEDMSKKELKDLVQEKIVDTDELITLPPLPTSPFENFPVMNGNKALIEAQEEHKKTMQKISEPKNVEDINNMSMQELRDFIEKNSVRAKTEKPVVQNDKLEIKEGMLFKNGMTMKEVKADKMQMSVKEMVGKEEGLRMSEVKKIKEGVTVEEMIAMKNDVSVVEMVAMKNDLSVDEVMKIAEVLPVAAIVQSRPEIPVEEALALKANMTMEELVAMKNDIPVEEVLELKEELEMETIMKLQDGITKEDAVAIIDGKATVEEIVEVKEAIKEVSKLEGITIESEKFPNFAKEGQNEMTIVDFNSNNDNGVRFTEVTDNFEDDGNFGILDSVRNVKPKPEKKEKRKKLQMKMRPLRVKVRKPISQVEEIEEDINPMDDVFGLKKVTNDELVLDPTPAVPGRPILQDTEVKNQFNEFIPSTTPTTIPIENIKTFDFQNEEVTEESDYPIYDIVEENAAPEAPKPPPTKTSFMADFPDMQIPFSNFPMMKPHEFINLIAEEMSEAGLEKEQDSFSIFNDPEETEEVFLDGQDTPEETSFSVFNNPDRPESIPPVTPYVNPTEPTLNDENDDLATFVDVFREEQELPIEERPVRRPQRPNPNHRYPIHPYAPTSTPFTAKPKGHIVDHSYIRNSYKHQTGKNNYGYESSYNRGSGFDSSDIPMFREISNGGPEIRYKRKPYQEKNPFLNSKEQSSETDVKPFTHFGSIKDDIEDTYEGKISEYESDYNDPSVVGVNFYNKYGQHDDRPLQLPKSPTQPPRKVNEEKDKKRPGEIRFGGMSFALPPPGSFPDIPQDEEDVEFEYYSDYESKTVSDVYPNHPASQIFPNRPVSEIFRDLPEKMKDPPFPPAGGIRIDETRTSGEIPSFDGFFDEDMYVDNPFGKDFIKLEIDHDRFDTNKTKPGVHHIPLDVYGFPDIPNYSMDEKSSFFDSKNERRKVKKSTKRKPLYKPPPVLTEYNPPSSSSRLSQEYRHTFSDSSSSNSNINNKMKDENNEPLERLASLPMLMEKLMGEHSAWIKRAWQGRDEAAAAA